MEEAGEGLYSKLLSILPGRSSEKREEVAEKPVEFQDSLNVLLLIKMSPRILNTKPCLFSKCVPVLALRLVNTMGKL